MSAQECGRQKGPGLQFPADNGQPMTWLALRLEPLCYPPSETFLRASLKSPAAAGTTSSFYCKSTCTRQKPPKPLILQGNLPAGRAQAACGSLA
jgi:hypothetical protein